ASQATYSSGGLLRHQPTAKEAVHAKAERAAKLHRLFLETKRKWLSILPVQSGVSLLEILERKVTPEDESRWRAAIQLELAKLEDRRQKQHVQWRLQWEAQQQASLLRESQEAMMMSLASGSNSGPTGLAAASSHHHHHVRSHSSASGRSSPHAQSTSAAPPAPPALPGEKVIRELSLMTFADLKRQVNKSMRILESERWVERTRKSNIGTGGGGRNDASTAGGPRPAYAAVFRVRRSDGYQGMLNAIARDIRTKAQRRERRRAEMRRIRITLLNLREKSDYLESQRQSYEVYLETCTKKLAAGGDSTMSAAQARARRMHSVMPFTRQYFHLRDLQRSGRVPRFGSFKYSAEKLYYKGVIVSVDGYPPRQLDKISLTISSDVPGVFDVQVSLMGVKMPGGGCEINMQDLLQLQYDNVQTMTLYEGSVIVNTNLLVYLINKNVVCIIIGTGCLQIPYAFAKSGWIGVAIVVLSAFIGGYTGVLTIKCLYYQAGQRLHSFPQIGRAAFGKYGQYATQFFNYLYSLGTTCLYIILAGQFIFQLLSTLGVGVTKKVWMILVTLIIWIPVALLKEMSEAAIMAIFGLLASVIVIAVATIMSIAQPYTKMHPTEPAPGTDIAIAIGIPVAMSSIVFSYSGSVVYPHVEASMKKPKQWPNVVYTAMGFCAVAYLLIGVSGYWAYGSDVVSPVLDSIPTGAPATIAKIMITLHVMIAAPIMLLTFFLEVELAWKINAERLGKKREFTVRLIYRSVVVGLVCAVALAIPYFSDFLGLISSIACVTMFAILPIVCYLKLYGHRIAPWYEKIWMAIVLIIGIVASIWGSVDSVKSLIRDVKGGAPS
ncbi:hypothetical protein GGI21_003154, partial [Coemansia aciculifera]